jgi:hypothetical protein
MDAGLPPSPPTVWPICALAFENREPAVVRGYVLLNGKEHGIQLFLGLHQFVLGAGRDRERERPAKLAPSDLTLHAYTAFEGRDAFRQFPSGDPRDGPRLPATELTYNSDKVKAKKDIVTLP